MDFNSWRRNHLIDAGAITMNVTLPQHFAFRQGLVHNIRVLKVLLYDRDVCSLSEMRMWDDLLY